MSQHATKVAAGKVFRVRKNWAGFLEAEFLETLNNEKIDDAFRLLRDMLRDRQPRWHIPKCTSAQGCRWTATASSAMYNRRRHLLASSVQSSAVSTSTSGVLPVLHLMAASLSR
jgi:hypothetical protein